VSSIELPTTAQIEACYERIRPWIVETPQLRFDSPTLREVLGTARLSLKMELFQRAGTFKPRGALAVMLDLDDEALARGVTAVSAGNHAMAVGYCASVLGSHAKVVMPSNANPGRIAGCRAYGAEVVLVNNVHEAFEAVRRIEREEGRTFVHPFEGPLTALGTATLGMEIAKSGEPLDAVIVPIGGGGLAAGVAAALKAFRPEVTVYGVEPEGADTMHRSFVAGEPRAIDEVRTIADSLGAPHAAPYSFELCRRCIDELVMITDRQMLDAMRLLQEQCKLAVEPAGAATTAALMGPLRDQLQGKDVVAIVCGANIDADTYCDYLRQR
jgi:threonine dehydratase